jgi:hypothetical protein
MVKKHQLVFIFPEPLSGSWNENAVGRNTQGCRILLMRPAPYPGGVKLAHQEALQPFLPGAADISRGRNSFDRLVREQSILVYPNISSFLRIYLFCTGQFQAQHPAILRFSEPLGGSQPGQVIRPEMGPHQHKMARFC